MKFVFFKFSSSNHGLQRCSEARPYNQCPHLRLLPLQLRHLLRNVQVGEYSIYSVILQWHILKERVTILEYYLYKLVN